MKSLVEFTHVLSKKIFNPGLLIIDCKGKEIKDLTKFSTFLSLHAKQIYCIIVVNQIEKHNQDYLLYIPHEFKSFELNDCHSEKEELAYRNYHNRLK